MEENTVLHGEEQEKPVSPTIKIREVSGEKCSTRDDGHT